MATATYSNYQISTSRSQYTNEDLLNIYSTTPFGGASSCSSRPSMMTPQNNKMLPSPSPRSSHQKACYFEFPSELASSNLIRDLPIPTPWFPTTNPPLKNNKPCPFAGLPNLPSSPLLPIIPCHPTTHYLQSSLLPASILVSAASPDLRIIPLAVPMIIRSIIPRRKP